MYARSQEDYETFEKEITIQAHEGPVWRTAWAHPKFGSVFASCSFDKTVSSRLMLTSKVKIWRQYDGAQWVDFYGFNGHQASGKNLFFFFSSSRM